MYGSILDCCGMGALSSLARDKSLEIFKNKVRLMIEEINPDLCVTGCSSCLIRFDNDWAQIYKQGDINEIKPSFHVAQLLALVLGAEPEKAIGLAESPVNKIIEKIRE